MSIKISCARKMAGVALAAAIGLSQPAMAGGEHDASSCGGFCSSGFCFPAQFLFVIDQAAVDIS